MRKRANDKEGRFEWERKRRMKKELLLFSTLYLKNFFSPDFQEGNAREKYLPTCHLRNIFKLPRLCNTNELEMNLTGRIKQLNDQTLVRSLE